MTGIHDNLNTLSNCKKDIKNTIESYNITVEDGMINYHEYIDMIEPIEYLPIGTKFGDTAATGNVNINTQEDINSISKYINPNEVDMSYMFRNAWNIVNAPMLSTHNVVNMRGMFYGCKKLVNVPLYDTSNVTNMSYMFSSCKLLTTIPLLDTSKVTDMNHMFSLCSKLTTIPLLDTSKVTDMSSMFYGTDITEIPQLDTSNVIDVRRMFDDCFELTSIPLLDFSSVKFTDDFTAYQSSIQTTTPLTNLGGFKNLGMQENMLKTVLNLDNEYEDRITSDINIIKTLVNITYESVMNVINNLYDRASAGYYILNLYLNEKPLNLLNNEDIAIATNKGWIISSS